MPGLSLIRVAKAKKALSGLHDLSNFDDDPFFLVEIDGLREKIRAPSRVVLEHALWRKGLDKFKVERL